MQGRMRILVALVVVLAAGGVAWTQLGGNRAGAVELTKWVPQNARAVMWLDDLSELLTQLDQLGGRLEGAGGIAEAFALALGVEQPTPTAINASGMVAESGAALFIWRNAAWACIAARPKRGIDHVKVWLGQRGLDLARAELPDTWHVRLPGQEKVVATVWRRGHALIARAPLPTAWETIFGRQPNTKKKPNPQEGADSATKTAADADDPARALRQLEASPKGLPKAPNGGVHLRARMGPGDAVRPALRRGLGMTSLLFGGLVDAVQGFHADLAVHGQAVKLALRLPSAPKANSEIARYHDGFLPKSSAPLDLGAVLPDEVALWLRAHLNPRQLDMIPSFLRDRVLPPTMLKVLHPALAKVNARTLLIDRLEGRLAGGVLGVDDKASLDLRVWRRVGLQRLVGGFVAGTLQKPADTLALSTAVHDALIAGGEKLAPLKLGPWVGWTGEILGTEVSLVHHQTALLLISGKGELARFRRTAQGKFPSLGKVAATPMEKAMAADSIGWIGMASTTGRIARAARRRGVPDAFVRMVRGVASITAGVQLDADGIAAEVQLRPRVEARP